MLHASPCEAEPQRVEPKRRADPTDRGSRLDHLIEELNDIARRSSLDSYLSFARSINGILYNGCLSAWAKRRARDPAFCKLSADPRLKVHPSKLYRSMRVLELLTSLPAISSMKNISGTHIAAVLGLDQESQLSFLRQAEEQRWTVAELAEAVGKLRRSCPARGRPKLGRVVRTLGALGRLHHDAFDDSHVLDDLDAADLVSFAGVVRKTRNELDHIILLIERALSSRRGTASARRLLLIDAEPARARATRKHLEQSGFSVRIVHARDQAFALRAVPFDCVITAGSLADDDVSLVSSELVESGIAQRAVSAPLPVDLAALTQALADIFAEPSAA